MNFCLECGVPTKPNVLFCSSHVRPKEYKEKGTSQEKVSIASLYPKYYKDVSKLTEVDVYVIHYLFDIQDPSGAIQHASKKLLLSGVRTGGKSKRDDIKEARDTLTRWLELDAQLNPS